MNHILKPHTGITNVTLSSTLELSTHKLLLTFRIEGELEKYVFLEKREKKRVDELWRSTCFELFLASSKSEEYYELNFSSSLAWNYYYLSEYRAEVKEVENVALSINTSIKENIYEVNIILESNEFNFELFDMYNIATILLTREGERTFWSLHKMEENPDFHNKEFFNKRKNYDII